MSDFDLPTCSTRPRLGIRRRIAAVLNALRLRRAPMMLPPGWGDDDGLAAARVPRRPRPPSPGGSVALEVPDSPPGG